MTLEKGQVLQNRYRIVSALGKGGMGAVYRAWNTRLNVAVALKEMVPQPGLSAQKLAQLRRQFRQEAQVLARLDHPHLVGVTDFFAEGGSVYLVMKFIEGESLAQCIEKHGALSEDEVVRLAEQLLDALDYCHREGVIHRDVKPENVIIRPDGAAVLVDFGLVKLWDPDDPRTKTAMRGMGTPEYAPPEQYDVHVGHTDARSDVYSLGATLYHALTGEAPPTATQRIASRNAFRPPRALNRRISSRMEAAVLRAMELTVEDRFQSAKEMLMALTGRAEGRRSTRVMGSDGASSIPLPTRIPTWAWAMGAGAVLVALGVGAVRVWPLFGATEATPTAAVEEAATSAAVNTTAAVVETAQPTPSPLPTTARPTLTPSATPTSAPTSTPVDTPTPGPTSTAVDTSTPEASPTPTPSPTNTPSAAPTSPARPTATAAPSATEPTLLAPAQGGTYQSPVTFQWQGSLGAGQAYQVTARHIDGSAAVQSGPLTGTSWSADLPAEHHGDWRWTVAVIQEGSTVMTSSEGMFWFDPQVGGGGGGGGGGTDEPEPEETRKPTPKP